MAPFSDMSVKQRLGAGLLFLVIALGVLVTRPWEPMIIAVIAGLSLLISAVFFLTVGRDTVEDTGYDMGFWLLAVVTATAAYIGAGFGIRGEIDTPEFLVFIIGFGILLGLLAEIRDRISE